MLSEKTRHSLIPFLLALLTLAVYVPVLRHGFINFDDFEYVVDNPHVSGGLTAGNIRWAFTAIYQANWHPLTWISHMMDVELFGLDPSGHHFTSLLLHTANTLLLHRFLRRTTGFPWRSAVVAALFAIHPLHVESVAWVAERKDLLATFFFMTTLLAYSRYCKKGSLATYLLTLGSFALGLLCKPMLVTLPFLLLLLDYWPMGRFPGMPVSRLLAEKLPFLALTVASSWITWIAQQTGIPNPSIPLPLKLASATTAYGKYLYNMLWPSGLAVLYPFDHSIAQWKIAASVLFLAVMTSLVLLNWRRCPFLPVGWFWYLGTLVPVIGLVTVGYQASADRYTYIPLTGIFIMIVWGCAELAATGTAAKQALAVAAVLAISGLATVCRGQLGYWKDSITLFTRTVAVTGNNFVAWNNLGAAYHTAGKPEEAVRAYRSSLAIKPSQAPPHNNIGLILASQGKLDEAVRHYATALSLAPGYREAGCNLGVALIRMGRLRDAVEQFARTIRLKLDDPGQIDRFTAGLQLVRGGRHDAAITLFDEAVRQDPANARGYGELGALLIRFGR